MPVITVIIDHRILHVLLEHSYGLIGNVLSYIKSYINNIFQHISIGKSNLAIWEPLRSVLWPCKYPNPDCCDMLPIWFILQRLCRCYPCVYRYNAKLNLVRRLQKTGSLSSRYQYLEGWQYYTHCYINFLHSYYF